DDPHWARLTGAAWSVHARLVVGVSARLQLEGGVFQVEMTGEAGLEMVKDPSGLPFGDAVVGDHDVGGEDRSARGEGPGMEVVDGENLGQLEDVAAHLGDLHVVRGRLDENAQRGPEQTDGSPDHEGDDDQRGDGVGPAKPGGHDDRAGDNGADECIEVGEDVLEGAFDVERPAVGPGQGDRCGQVHSDADEGHNYQHRTVHLGRVDQPADGFVGDKGGDQQQGESVSGGGEDLGAVQPEGVAVSGGAGGQVGGDE